MDFESIQNVILEIILKHDFLQYNKEFDYYSPLIDYGLDSIALVNLIVCIEEQYEIQFEIDELILDNFNNINTISMLVSKKIGLTSA